jgi:hypothetical protein
MGGHEGGRDHLGGERLGSAYEFGGWLGVEANGVGTLAGLATFGVVPKRLFLGRTVF